MSVIKLISAEDTRSIIKRYFEKLVENETYKVDVIDTNADLQKLIRELPEATMLEADHDCVIGLWKCIRERLMTLDGLKREVEEEWYNYNFIRKDYGGACVKPLTLEQQLDSRRNNNFEKFSFCPICGRKINWEKMKKEVLKNDRV